MKLHKPLIEMTSEEAFSCLQSAAIATIKGEDLPGEVRLWIGYGLLAMCGDEKKTLNDAFDISKTKVKNPFLDATRYAMVEHFRSQENLTKEAAIFKVADIQKKSAETILTSVKNQTKIQKNLNKKKGP